MIEYYKFNEIQNLILEGRLSESIKLIKDLQEVFIVISDENFTLKVQVHELEDLLFLSRKLIFDGSAYWFISEGGRQGPFCFKCYHKDGSLIRMKVEDHDPLALNAESIEKWICSRCNTIITVAPESEDTLESTSQAKIHEFGHKFS